MCEYQYDIFKNRSAFPNSKYPFCSKDLETNIEYKDGLCPEAEQAFKYTINLGINELGATQC